MARINIGINVNLTNQSTRMIKKLLFETFDDDSTRKFMMYTKIAVFGST